MRHDQYLTRQRVPATAPRLPSHACDTFAEDVTFALEAASYGMAMHRLYCAHGVSFIIRPARPEAPRAPYRRCLFCGDAIAEKARKIHRECLWARRQALQAERREGNES